MKRTKQKDKPVYSEKVIHRAKILDLLIEEKITQMQAAREIELKSTRQVRRLIKKYCRGNCSLASLVHRKSRPPWNRIDTVIRDKVKEIKIMHPNFSNPHIAHNALKRTEREGDTHKA